MGAFPENKFHLFPVLLMETRPITLPLNTSIFPAMSFKNYIDTASTDSKSPSLFPVSPLFSQFLNLYKIPKNNMMEIHPFEYFILRYLHSLNYLPVKRVYYHSLLSQIHNPIKPQGSILAIQLFLHYLYYLMHPNNPTKPMISSISSIPSLARPDMFFLQAINELWLNRDDRIINDWPSFLRQCSHQQTPVILSYLCIIHSLFITLLKQ